MPSILLHPHLVLLIPSVMAGNLAGLGDLFDGLSSECGINSKKAGLGLKSAIDGLNSIQNSRWRVDIPRF